MAEEIAFENGRISNFEGLVTLTLTLDRVILHSIVHHSSTSTYSQISLNSKKLSVDGKMYACTGTYVRMDKHTDGHLRPALLGRLCRRVDLKIADRLTSVDVDVFATYT